MLSPFLISLYIIFVVVYARMILTAGVFKPWAWGYQASGGDMIYYTVRY